MKIIVTEGAGFIDSALVRLIINKTDHDVLKIDKLTYAGHLESVINSEHYQFEQVDICDAKGINRNFNEFQPDFIVHLAAESHVDRSIDESAEFIRTNISGTHILLEAARHYRSDLGNEIRVS